MLILLQYFLKKIILQFKGKKKIEKKLDWGIIKIKFIRELIIGYLLKGLFIGGLVVGN